MKAQLFIISLGHLAKFVINENKQYSISGTYRDIEKIAGIDFETYEFNSEKFSHNQSIPKDVDFVLWNLPPTVSNYFDILKYFHKYFQASTKWIFISSTSVYGNGNINELSQRLATSDNSKNLIQLEDFVTEIDRTATIIRPGGLIDEIRNPAYRISKMREFQNGDSPVNIVDTSDLARFILHLIDNALWNNTFNFVSDCHESKKEFYSKQLEKLNLPSPKWIAGNENSKIINNEKVKKSGFKFL